MRVVFDVETISNLFSLTALNVDTQQVSAFVIHKDRDDSEALREFLGKCTLMIGFNNIDFDYPLIIDFLDCTLKRPQSIARSLYQKGQELISEQDSEGKKVRKIMRWYGDRISQCDLARIGHYTNKGRFATLKWLAINMGFPDIQEMPIPHDSVVELEQIPVILEYNLNDVKVTYELWKRFQGKIEMRKKLSEKYEVDMSNFPDPRIGETIVLKKLSEKLSTPMNALKRCRTFRKEIRIKDCILPSISFKTPEFNEILTNFRNMVILDTRKSNDLTCTFDGVPYHFGIGGIHAYRASGVYTGVNTCDVSGYYPTLAVSQGFSPHHFGEAFVQVYSEIAKERAQYPKKSDESIALKLAQNGVFGKSNSIYSPFYDPFFFCQITINGQLLLAMLCERITTMEAGRIIMANTDGIEVEVKDQTKFEWICKCWEDKFGLKLEHSKYRLIAIRDANAYLAIGEDGSIKEKGAFENILSTPPMELHKNHSSQIVPIAIREYFLNGTPVEKTINDCNDISRFLIGERARVGRFSIRGLENGELYEKPLPKHIRYYVSKGGGVLIKSGTKAATSQVQKGFQITLMNKWSDYSCVNKTYYAKEARKLLQSICG